MLALAASDYLPHISAILDWLIIMWILKINKKMLTYSGLLSLWFKHTYHVFIWRKWVIYGRNCNLVSQSDTLEKSRWPGTKQGQFILSVRRVRECWLSQETHLQKVLYYQTKQEALVFVYIFKILYHCLLSDTYFICHFFPKRTLFWKVKIKNDNLLSFRHLLRYFSIIIDNAL